MNVKNINEVLSECNEAGFKNVALQNSAREFILNFNSPKGTLESQLKKIERLLNSNSTPPGVYVILAKANNLKKTKASEFIYTKEGTPGAGLHASGTPQNYLSWDEALKLNTENQALQFKVDNLKKENDELHELIKDQKRLLDDYEAEDNEAEETQAEGTESALGEAGSGSLIKTLVETLAPSLTALLSANLELKQKQLDNERLKILNNGGQPGQQQKPAAQQLAPDLREVLLFYMELKKESPEIYAQLLQQMQSERKAYNDMKEGGANGEGGN